ncbi:carboxypeptidase-like regulatory domain-containing protein [Hanstruepera marina]|uniref:carboxypeptidase-like regulatory domain-containing protein n=1 Tax=Hanstruepera marina TaxID=2873265 RepID=UPI001CA66313|nr:carboxypeptidase-like regulatory domain-containing protein [Hanstruepera marina]
MKLWLFIILGILGFVGNSQTQLSGTVKDSSDNPVESATVIIKKTNTQVIIAYTVTDELGGFSIQIDSVVKGLEMEIQSLGFMTWKNILEAQKTHFDIILQESVEELREVILKTDPIRQRGDTLAYAVSAFKNKSDRTIADVIEKMPGMNVLPSGQITYMGEPIEKYYIEGLDLMEGKYKLANESISADDVARVEVLENHQPIKVLDSLVGSDRTSINIKLKNNVSLSGKAELGAGFSPGLIKTTITPLLLSKKRQTLVSYQYNNTGEDLASNFKSFSSSQSLLPEFNTSKKGLLEVQQLQKPPFTPERWLDNSDHYGTINHLERLKKEMDLKINLSYLNGSRLEMGSQKSTYISSSDSLNYLESINNKYYLHSLDSKITLEKNTSKNYFKNELSSQSYWDSSQGLINNNASEISQQLSSPYWNLKNHFHILMPIGKQLIEFNSKTGYVSTNQELIVAPGTFVDFFNNGESYDQIHQYLEYRAFYTDNTVGLAKKLGKFTLAPTVGLSFRKEQFESEIITTITNTFPNTSNNYSLKSTTFFISNKLEYKDKIWQITLQTPLFVRSFKLPEYSISSKPLTFEPRIFVSKKLTPFWEVRLSGQISNSFGEAENLHNGFILKNYRSLVRYDPILSRQTQYNASTGLRYRNALKAVFGSLNFSIIKNKNNLIFDYQVSPEGGLAIKSIEQNNNQIQKNISFNFSKYLDSWKTTLSGGGSFYLVEQDQIVNNAFDRYKTYGQLYEFKADIDAEKWFGIKVNSTFNTSQLKSQDFSFNRVENWVNSVNAFFYLDKKQYLNGAIEHYYNNLQNSQNAVIMNIKYQYSFEKHPIDISLSWNNILNTRNYVNTQNNEYYNLQSLYVIRPSQVLLTALFTF